LTPLRNIEIIGDMILAWLPFASAIARGALFGVGANGAGTARAHQIGETEGRWQVAAVPEALYARQSLSSVVRFTSPTHF
jgi:putative effector of murein hydrolase